MKQKSRGNFRIATASVLKYYLVPWFLEQFKELVKLRKDYDSCPSVGSLTFFRVIWRNRQILSSACSRHVRRGDTVFLL